MFTIADIQSKIDNTVLVSCPSGTLCTFVQLDENWGVKLYADERDAEENYHTQKIMHHLGFSPAVGDYIGMLNYTRNVLEYSREFKRHYTTKRNRPYFGFITEVVKVGKNHAAAHEWSKEKLVEFSKMLVMMPDALREGIKSTIQFDNHAGNWGLNKDGKPVKLDVDCFTYVFKDFAISDIVFSQV